jgi:hypothetical protein
MTPLFTNIRTPKDWGMGPDDVTRHQGLTHLAPAAWKISAHWLASKNSARNCRT